MVAVLDEDGVLPSEVLLAMRASLQGRAAGQEGGRRETGLQDAVEINIPKRVMASHINKSLELARGGTYKPLPETAKGKHTVACTRDVWESGPHRQGVHLRHGGAGGLYTQVGTAREIQGELTGEEAQAQAQPQP